MAGEDPGRLIGPRPDGGRGLAGLAWSVLLNTVLVAAFAIGLIPIVAIVHGFIDLVVQSKNRSGADWIAYGFAFTGLFLGAVFFAYAIKYYLSTVMVLLTTLVGAGPRSNGAKTNANGLTRINGNGNGNGFHIDLGYHPLVSIHVAAYNEKRVIERLLTALSKLDYPEYEVVVVDDSTDESVQILDRWRSVPRFKVLHRASRAGFKGGALREALKLMDSRTEYVVVFDADSVPFPDSIQRLLPLFYRVSDGKTHRRFGAAFGRADDPPSEPGQVKKRADVAAVQSYQWHVLNKSESWLTEAVRAEYAGSYMIERPFQDAIGSLKMIAGTAYMIRADILRQVGWGTSITEDWELTLNLYSRGYKVIYTPWAETPAECVSTFARLARQRMRWAEGHTHNVRKWFVKIMASPVVTPIEKLEFLYDSTYYLQAGLFVIGSLSWLISEVVFRTHVPGWTAVLGWSLLFSNIFALPLMNLGGLILEEAPVRDLQGVFGALVLSFALVPFQGWAAFKGLISRDEGPWFRTPKTGLVTDEVKHLRRLILLRRWLGGRRNGHIYGAKALAPAKTAVISRSYKRKLGWFVSTTLAVTIGLLWWQSLTAPVAEAAGNPLYLHGTGTSPGCAPSTMSPAPGGRAVPCSFGDGVAYFAYANLPAQTIPAGTWKFTLYWSLGVPVPLSNITLSVGVISGGSCVGFAPALVTWSGTFGLGPNPATLSTTTGTAVTIGAGQTLCLKVDLSVEQDDALMLYDTAAAPTSLTPPVTVVPESLLGFLGVALAIPVFTGRRRWLSWIKVRI
jgi:cellulose synthase/poly-beta-1,6-N-acetylglucosamine synthase-like glycosyltransferase